MDSEIIIYQTEDGQTKIETRFENETVWLTQEQIVLLFQRDQSVISRHINNIFSEGELDKESNMQKVHIANSDKPVVYYNLDMIISVGYRVNSKRGNDARLRLVTARTGKPESGRRSNSDTGSRSGGSLVPRSRIRLHS